jgi:hypothetical protein
MDYKFKVGDRVVNVNNVKDELLIKVGDTGTVIDEDTVPYVVWDRIKEVQAQYQEDMELLK